MWIPGAPRFAPGEDVVLCLEPAGDGYPHRVDGLLGVPRRRLRRRVRPDSHGRWRSHDRAAAWVGRIPGARLERFRAAAATVTGVRGTARRRRRRGRVDGGGRRGRGRPGAVHAARRRYPLARGRQRHADHLVPQHASRRHRCRPAMRIPRFGSRCQAWTDPPTAAISLAFGGTRLMQPDAQPNAPFCTADNLGAGVITFGDPLRRAGRRRPGHRRRLRQQRLPTSSTARRFADSRTASSCSTTTAAISGFTARAQHHAHPRARGRPCASGSVTPVRASASTPTPRTSCIPPAAWR